jgi:DNA mismatch repair protein MutS
VERITARIALRQVRPRELVALKDTLQKAELTTHADTGLPALLTKIFEDLQPPAGCSALLGRYVLDEPAA